MADYKGNADLPGWKRLRGLESFALLGRSMTLATTLAWPRARVTRLMPIV